MNKLPTPPPDRRLEVKKNTYTNSINSNDQSSESGCNYKEESQRYNNLNMLRIKHIEEMRKNILSYKVERNKRRFYKIKKCFYLIITKSI